MKKKTIKDLINICNEFIDCVENIRYQEWPIAGLGVGLNAEELDELLIEAARCVRNANTSLTKEKKAKEAWPSERLQKAASGLHNELKSYSWYQMVGMSKKTEDLLIVYTLKPVNKKEKINIFEGYVVEYHYCGGISPLGTI